MDEREYLDGCIHDFRLPCTLIFNQTISNATRKVR